MAVDCDFKRQSLGSKAICFVAFHLLFSPQSCSSLRLSTLAMLKGVQCDHGDPIERVSALYSGCLILIHRYTWLAVYSSNMGRPTKVGFHRGDGAPTLFMFAYNLTHQMAGGRYFDKWPTESHALRFSKRYDALSRHHAATK